MHLLVLYKDCWHEFWVRSWWPRVLRFAITMWLVNRGVAVRRGRPVEKVCNRKGATWYENHTVRFRQSPVRIESRIRETQPIRGVLSSLTIRLERGCKRLHSRAPRRRYGARRGYLSKYMSLHLSLKLTANCVPLSRIKWEIYFYKEVCFVSFTEVRSLSLIMFLVGSMRSIQHWKLIH